MPRRPGWWRMCRSTRHELPNGTESSKASPVARRSDGLLWGIEKCGHLGGSWVIGVSPNHPFSMGFSLTKTIHFGVPPFMETPIYSHFMWFQAWKMRWKLGWSLQLQWNSLQSGSPRRSELVNATGATVWPLKKKGICREIGTFLSGVISRLPSGMILHGAQWSWAWNWWWVETAMGNGLLGPKHWFNSTKNVHNWQLGAPKLTSELSRHLEAGMNQPNQQI